MFENGKAIFNLEYIIFRIYYIFIICNLENF